jgi:hypothetical protein
MAARGPMAFLAMIVAAFALALFVGEPRTTQAQSASTFIESQQLLKTNTSTTVPVAIAIAGKKFSEATFIGKKDYRTSNTGNVWVGVTTNDNQQPFLISPGESVTVSAPKGTYFDLNKWYLDVATANDGVVVIYSY